VKRDGGIGGVAVNLIVTDHLDDEQSLALFSVTGDEFLITAETETLDVAISAAENFLVGTEWPEEIIVEDTPPLAIGAADPACPWHTLEQPDTFKDGGAGETGADAHCS
jgi:hypothetical protein